METATTTTVESEIVATPPTPPTPSTLTQSAKAKLYAATVTASAKRLIRVIEGDLNTTDKSQLVRARNLIRQIIPEEMTTAGIRASERTSTKILEYLLALDKDSLNDIVAAIEEIRDDVKVVATAKGIVFGNGITPQAAMQKVVGALCPLGKSASIAENLAELKLAIGG